MLQHDGSLNAITHCYLVMMIDDDDEPVHAFTPTS